MGFIDERVGINKGGEDVFSPWGEIKYLRRIGDSEVVLDVCFLKNACPGVFRSEPIKSMGEYHT